MFLVLFGFSTRYLRCGLDPDRLYSVNVLYWICGTWVQCTWNATIGACVGNYQVCLLCITIYSTWTYQQCCPNGPYVGIWNLYVYSSTQIQWSYHTMTCGLISYILTLAWQCVCGYTYTVFMSYTTRSCHVKLYSMYVPSVFFALCVVYLISHAPIHLVIVQFTLCLFQSSNDGKSYPPNTIFIETVDGFYCQLQDTTVSWVTWSHYTCTHF